MQGKYWLMKAEPDSRISKGKDVKFSVDDFESVKVTAWEGVRSYEARNLMKEMKVGDKVLFYHSNCKEPGIAGFAEVSKEAYPDYTAWDTEHPYYDPKTKQEDPKWYMVNVTFSSRAVHFVPLALLRHIADSSSNSVPDEIEYIGENGIKAIKEMNLVTRGRLSVQRVEEDAWHAIELLAEKGGWGDLKFGKKKLTKQKGEETERKGIAKRGKATARKKRKRRKNQDDEDDDDDESDGSESDGVLPRDTEQASSRKHKAENMRADQEVTQSSSLRRSTRTRKIMTS